MSDRYWDRQTSPYGGGGGHSPTTALVLGILGLVLCGFLAPFAWYIGTKAYEETGDGMAKAGQILGIIGTVLLVISVIAVLALLGSSSSNSSYG
jgi:uncharacterized membrane-anchored protein